MKVQLAPGFRASFSPSLLLLLATFIALFFAFVDYELPTGGLAHVQQYYGFLIEVEAMIFFGFGLLMTFLRRYTHSAVALNFLSSAMVMIEAILLIGAVQQGLGHGATRIGLSLQLLIDSAFCAGSAMIAFGAVLGKTTPTELLWIFALMVPIYALTQHLVFHTLSALDVGGSISIHVFGAYFGLAASCVLSRPGRQHGYLGHAKAGASYFSNVFSIMGTLFLFLYWPSFNAALASVSDADEGEATLSREAAAAQGVQQFLCIVNTMLSLLGSVLTAFATSAAIGGRLDMMHVQNATLAGGVAMGSAAALRMTPGGALLVGSCAGALSTLGFAYLSPFLEQKLSLGDTCGVHNLHAIPGIIGGLVAGFASLSQPAGSAALLPVGAAAAAGGVQLGMQVAAVVSTIAIALAGGALAALLVGALLPARERVDGALLFDDGAWWTDVDVELLPVDVSSRSRHSAMGVPYGGSTQGRVSGSHRPAEMFVADVGSGAKAAGRGVELSAPPSAAVVAPTAALPPPSTSLYSGVVAATAHEDAVRRASANGSADQAV